VQSVPDLHLREPIAGLVAKIASRLNGGIVPAAVTIGSDTIYLVDLEKLPPAERAELVAHEEAHKAQARRLEPRFIPRFGPLGTLRRLIGEGRFIEQYIRLHFAHGYSGNPLELEAAAAAAAAMTWRPPA
jgi:hypothetical protein